MNRSPLVSVIMGVYNRKVFLREAIESILNQSQPNFELIMVNDGSAKEIRDYLCSFKDPRIVTVHRQRHGGIAAARNEGLRHARGKWITFFDSDDIMPRHSLRLRLKALKENPKFRAVFGRTVFIGSRKKKSLKKNPMTTRINKIVYQFARRFGELPKGVAARLALLIPWPLTSQLFHSSIIQSIGRLDESFLISDDTEFAYRINHLTSSLFVDAPVLRYRFHDSNFSLLHSEVIPGEFLRIEEKRKIALQPLLSQ